MGTLKRSTIYAVLMLAAVVVSGSREIAFRHGAETTTGTVRAWQSGKLGGFTGTARVDVDSRADDAASKNRPANTVLWYRPAAGERVVILRKPSGALKLGSLWQGFGMAGIALLLSLALGLASWFTREPAREEASEQ